MESGKKEEGLNKFSKNLLTRLANVMTALYKKRTTILAIFMESFLRTHCGMLHKTVQ
jgi:hypothetical protein